MAEQGRVRWPWIVLTAVIVALVACSAGLAVGGAAGYMLGLRSEGSGLKMRPEVTAPTPTPNVAPEDRWNLPGSAMQYGALIISVVAKSPAEEAGLRAGDVVISVDGVSLSREGNLAEVVSSHKPGDVVTLDVTRAGDDLELKVTLGTNPDKAGRVAWLGVQYRVVPVGIGPDLRISPRTN